MNKSSLRKRFTSLMLAAVMTLGLVPTSVFPAFAASVPSASYPEVLEKNNGEKTFHATLTTTISDDPDDTAGKIYSERTIPKKSGHNRGLGLYLGYIDPTDSRNEGAGGNIFCYDHTKGADNNMSVTINELIKEDDPLSVLIYYNGFTSGTKDGSQITKNRFLTENI